MKPLFGQSCWDLQEVGVEATLCHLSFLSSSLAPYFPHPTLLHLPPGVGGRIVGALNCPMPLPF